MLFLAMDKIKCAFNVNLQQENKIFKSCNNESVYCILCTGTGTHALARYVLSKLRLCPGLDPKSVASLRNKSTEKFLTSLLLVTDGVRMATTVPMVVFQCSV